MQDAKDWGDSVDEASGTPSEIQSEIPSSAEMPEMFTPESSSEGDSIPDELRDLVSLSGVKLVCCVNAWKVDGWAAKLRKHLSVTFTIDEDITGEDILDGFEHAGFDMGKIVSIQRCISNRSWVVSFSEQDEKDQVISKSCVTIKGTVVFLGDADTRTDFVKTFEAPDETPDTVIIGRLSCFGLSTFLSESSGARNGRAKWGANCMHANLEGHSLFSARGG